MQESKNGSAQKDVEVKPNEQSERSEIWICEGCGRQLSPYQLTRVGIGVHHYDREKDKFSDGLLNCGLVKRKG